VTCEEYKTARQLRGSQQNVADQLQLHRMTIAKRESGENPIDREAQLAMMCLPKLRPKIYFEADK
jgi:hypothetical protein